MIGKLHVTLRRLVAAWLAATVLLQAATSWAGEQKRRPFGKWTSATVYENDFALPLAIKLARFWEPQPPPTATGLFALRTDGMATSDREATLEPCRLEIHIDVP